MAKLDALAEKFYKLIHRLTGDTVSDASAVAGMSINEVCDKLQEEIGNGNLDLVDELAELADVALATPADGQVLTYDSTAAKWKNANASGGGGSFVVTVTENSGTYSVDKTLSEINDALESGLLPIAIFDDNGAHYVYHYSQGNASGGCMFNNINPTYNESWAIVGFELKTLVITANGADITNTTYSDNDSQGGGGGGPEIG